MMPNLWPQRAGYQSDPTFIGPILPGSMRGKISTNSPLDNMYDDSFVPETIDNRTFTVYEGGTKDIIQSGISWNRAIAIRGAHRLLFGTTVDIIETSDTTPEKFSHTPSDIYQKNPENDSPAPTPPEHDWKAAAKKAHAARMFVNKTQVHETRVTAHIDPAHGFRNIRRRVSLRSNTFPSTYFTGDSNYYFEHVRYENLDTGIPHPLDRKGFVVIDVRTMEVVWGSEDKQSSRSYIEQRIAVRGNKVWHYRVIAYRDFSLYMARVKVLGFRVTYLGKTVVIGTEKDIRNFFHSHKEPNIGSMKMEKYNG